MRTVSCLKLVAAATVVLTVSTAWAQPQGRGRGGFFGRGFGAADPTALLTQESVQKELELTDDQKSKATTLADEAQQARREAIQASGFQPGQMPSEEEQQAFQKKMQDLTASYKKKVADMLVPKQQERLDQITLQYSLEGQTFNIAGTASALSQDDLSKKLGLSDDQKKKLEDLQGEAQQKAMDLFQGGGPPDQQEMAKLRTDFKDKAMGVLTADQKTKLESLQGKKFDVSTIQMRGFGRGRGRGPGA